MTLRGSTEEFPLESVVGLLAGTSKTGELQVRGGGRVGALGFASGRLVAAVMDSEVGENALGAVFAITDAEFEFTSWSSAPEANLEAGDLVALLKRAAEARDRLAGIRASIPDDRNRFKLSEKAADGGAVTFTPDRWRALLAVNGERDVLAIAEQLRLGRMDTLTLLAGLVKDGVVEVLPPATVAPPPPPAAVVAPEPPPPPAPLPEPEPAVQAESEPEAVREELPPEPEWPLRSEPEPAPPSEASEAMEAMEWTPSAPTTPEPPAPEPPSRPEVRADLQAELAERFGGFAPAREERPSPPPPPAAEVPPAVDDRLASLTGIFAPGPAASGTPPKTPEVTERPPLGGDPWGGPPPAHPPTSWMTPSPAVTESPANAWAPSAKPTEAPPSDPWAPSAPLAPEAPAAPAPRADEWAPPPPVPQAPPEKKKGGFFARFRKEDAPSSIARIPAAAVASKAGMLASLSNALLMEYNSGSYGKGKIETRMANLLMRVDEQADPIDRPLPIVDDLIDATALEREGFPEEQAVPYLATLVRQIYEDAERAFGKDKAKKGYKTAQQQVFGGDAPVLQSPDLAGKLPKV